VTPPKDRAGDNDIFLRELGERLRLIRAQRGMSRRVLSNQSGVSERYIAQFEAGAGNMSLLLLRRLARALGVPTEELVAVERPDRSLDAILLDRFLSRLTDPQFIEARRMLTDHFAAGQADGRRERIALIGLRGAGKSSLGHRLAAARGVPFLELDQEVERLSQMDLRDIFAVHGQDGFRRLEREALQRAVSTEVPIVIAAGGGLVAEPTTFELLLANCLTVWVKASPEDHMRRVVAQGDQRPMADDQPHAMDDLRAILASREPLYGKADLVLDTAGHGLEDSFAELLRILPTHDPD
jgi:XRE family aerobic/anaerobic benzoate catabolism transcriptional regulator